MSHLFTRETVIHIDTATAEALADSIDACPSSAFGVLWKDNVGTVNHGALLQRDIFGLAASSLCLLSNIIATILIVFKIW